MPLPHPIGRILAEYIFDEKKKRYVDGFYEGKKNLLEECKS